jgi:hypothetical protein
MESVMVTPKENPTKEVASHIKEQIDRLEKLVSAYLRDEEKARSLRWDAEDSLEAWKEYQASFPANVVPEPGQSPEDNGSDSPDPKHGP